MRLRSLSALLCLLTLLSGQALFAQTDTRRTETRKRETRKSGPKKATTKRPSAAATGKPALPPAKPAPKITAAAGILGEADRAYDRKSYAAALKKYREAIAAKRVPQSRRALVDYRVARCLGWTKQWDSAMAATVALTSRYPGGLWEARARAWLMQLYLKVPHEVWQVGPRFYRTEDAPEVQSEHQPVQVEMRDQDLSKAVTQGEQAKALYEKIRKDLPSTEEEAGFSADLARVVAAVELDDWADAKNWKAPGDPTWQLDRAAPYDPSWAPPKKVLQLYLHAERLGTKNQRPVARLAQALWLRQYQQAMREYAIRIEADGKAEPIPFPYQDRSAIELLRGLTKDYPTHPEADHARVIVARLLVADGKPASGLDAFQQYLKDNPNGKWAEAAKASIESITRLRLSVANPSPQAPGAKAVLSVRAQNVPSLKFTAHRVRLEEMIRDARVLGRPQASVTSLLTSLGKTAGVAKFYQGDPVNWEVKLEEKPSYLPISKNIETPLAGSGAYVVEVDGGPVRRVVLLVISDLAVIQMVERDRIHAMVVDAASGAPVQEASAIIREVYRFTDGKEEKQQVSAITATTGADGLAEKLLAPKRTVSDSIVTFAWKGDRYALTGNGWAGPVTSEAGAGRTAYVYTERPVYRPSQVVHYRALLATRAGDGRWAPAKGRKVKVGVYDPNGAEIATADLESSEFGSVSGKLELASEPALGEYRIRIADAAGQPVQDYGFGTFRVEEYKKPEFEVTVRGPAAPARVGDRITARVSARYYFGAPVAGAKVKYTVTRSEFFPANPFPRPYEYLYDRSLTGEERWGDGDWTPVRDGEVASGEATTNADGEAAITIDASLADPRLKGRHLLFTISAEVTDASRRTITGTGTVRALASQFNSFLRVRQGFYSLGDTLQADIRTLDADGRPVSVSGMVRVYRVVNTDPREAGKQPEMPIHQAPLKTDAGGRAVFTWKPDQAGHYLVRFEARDAWEQLVVGEERAWIAGDMAGAGVFHNRHVLLIPEQTTYRIGGKAKVLLVSDEPSATVLLTQEAGDRILDKRVIRMKSRSMVIEVPLGREQSPDVVLAVTGIRDREYFRSEARLYVPPAEQLLTMEVTADRATYKPGEKAVFKIRARDVEGKGVRTEASVGVVDSSLFYIAGESAGPIAAHFYAGERGSSLRAQESLSPAFEDLYEDTQPRIQYDGPQWSFPDELGGLDADAFEGLYSEFALDSLAQTLSAGEEDAPQPQMPGGPAPSVPAAAREKARKIKGIPGFEAGPGPRVRSSFADTAFWSPAVVTDANGEATVEVTWPDNLTRWRATTRGWTQSAQVGEAQTEVTTSKDLLVRLQSPRFFVERDEVVLSANVHNYTQTDQRVRVELQLEGDTLYSAARSPFGPPRPRILNVPRPDRPAPAAVVENRDGASADPSLEQWIDLPKGGEKRLDWRVRVERPGEARIRVVAEGASDSDAMELGFPVYTHGVEKLVVKSGSMLMTPNEKPGSRAAKLTVDLPVERATDSGELIVQINPSAATAMLDALPYLVDYPYGCIEQTMSRWLPAAVSAKALTDLGISLQDLQRKARAEYERLAKQSATDQAQLTGYTYPEGSPGLRDVRRMMLARWEWRAGKSPVYNAGELNRIVAEGLARIRSFQNEDGGWGWWKDDASDPRMTAYVVQGLIAGKAAGAPPSGDMVARGLAFLDRAFVKETDVNDLAYMGWVLSYDPFRAKKFAPALLERGYAKRQKLSPYGLALLALALHQSGKPAEAKICLGNLENTAKVDDAAGTVSWAGGKEWWRWYHSPVETAATCLRAFNKIDPKHRFAPMIVRWLSNRRTGDAWSSTKDTSLAVQALAEYVRLHKELAPDYTVTVAVGPQFKREFKVTAENALLFDNRMVIPAPALGNGPQTITITREGKGNLYYQAFLRYFSLEEGIQAAGNEIRVRRRYFRLEKPAAGANLPKDAPVTQDGYLRSLIRPGQRLTSGDLVEVELLIESKNDYEYLVFEDMKPAGCEPVDLQSGTRYGNGLCSNMELRDEKVAFFVTRLPQGKRILTYRVRAEIPGAFHALPLNGYAMYAPEIRCISDEGSFGIEDAAPRSAAR